jgi:hypothetical protein
MAVIDDSGRGGIQPTASKVITGGRAVVSITGPTGGPVVIGIFDSCNVSESISSEDIHILGKYGPDEITLVSYNAVQVNCSGFRVYGYGVKALGQFPTLNQLLGLGNINITISDRENPTGPALATIINCLPDTNSNSFQSRATSKISITYKGTMMVDESAPNDSESGSTSLP